MMEGMITLLPLISGWRLRINNSWWQIQGQPSRDNPIFTHTLAGTRCSPETFSFFFFLSFFAPSSCFLLFSPPLTQQLLLQHNMFILQPQYVARSLARRKSGSLGARRQAKWKCTSCASFKSALFFFKKQTRAELDMQASVLRSQPPAATDFAKRVHVLKWLSAMFLSTSSWHSILGSAICRCSWRQNCLLNLLMIKLMISTYSSLYIFFFIRIVQKRRRWLRVVSATARWWFGGFGKNIHRVMMWLFDWLLHLNKGIFWRKKMFTEFSEQEAPPKKLKYFKIARKYVAPCV